MNIRFFARLREALGSPSLELPDSAFPMSVAALRERVRDAAEGDFALAMDDPNVLCAVNQQFADDDSPIEAGDEVAFFPPVTGG
jgi:molybdopterin synthase sulfur carrier subunit